MAATFEELQEVSMEGFQVVSGDMFRNVTRLSLPSITLWHNSISFSRATVRALNNCERIRIEVNSNTKCILLVPVTSKDKDAVRWVKTGKEIQPRKIECLNFATQLFSTWGWNKKNVYRAVGRIVTSDSKLMLLFDFNDPESWQTKEKAVAK